LPLRRPRGRAQPFGLGSIVDHARQNRASR
jgi:hypothetical protein